MNSMYKNMGYHCYSTLVWTAKCAQVHTEWSSMFYKSDGFWPMQNKQAHDLSGYFVVNKAKI